MLTSPDGDGPTGSGLYDGPMADEEEREPFEDEPLGEDERELLKQDLVDVNTLKELLAPRGIKGTVFYCPDCNEDHYLAWDLLKGNLQELLQAGESPIHEPAFNPNPEEYVGWDYARGYLDGYESLNEEEQQVLSEMAGKLFEELLRRGLEKTEVKGLFASIGLETPRGGDPGRSS